MADRWIDYQPLEEIAGATSNPKGHDHKGIRASIEGFGFVEPIVRDERTGRLVAGHGRLEQLRAIHAAQTKRRRKSVPDGVKVAPDGGWLIPVNRGWASTDDAHADAYLVAANRLTERGGWDDHGLAALLVSIQDYDPALLALTAVDDAALAALLDQVAAAPLPAPEDDPDPGPARPVISTAGDVWLLGPHRLAVGDATDPAVIAAAMGATGPAQLLLTDPPYGVSYTGRTAAALTIAGDDDGAPALLADALTALEPHLQPGATFYVFHASESIAMQLLLRTAPWRVRQCLVWCKSSFSLGRADYHYAHEPIAAGELVGVDATFETVAYGDKAGGPGKGRGRRAGGWYGTNAESTVLHYPKPSANPDHPTPKPVPLLERLIGNSTRRGHIVVDVFAGSGSTLIACHNLQRLARLVELDPMYADGICRRWQHLTKTPPPTRSHRSAGGLHPAG